MRVIALDRIATIDSLEPRFPQYYLECPNRQGAPNNLQLDEISDFRCVRRCCRATLGGPWNPHQSRIPLIGNPENRRHGLASINWPHHASRSRKTWESLRIKRCSQAPYGNEALEVSVPRIRGMALDPDRGKRRGHRTRL